MKKWLFVCILSVAVTALNACGRDSGERPSEVPETLTQEHSETISESVETTVAVNSEGMNSKEVPCLGSGSEIYVLQYNNDEPNSLKYSAADGEWRRPSGVYSFCVSEDTVFVDDSANNRIAAITADDVKYLVIPEGYVCTQMKYLYDENKLVYLLLDNLAVEPQNLYYGEWKLSDSEAAAAIEEWKTVGTDSVLGEKGEAVERPVLGYRSPEWDRFNKELGDYLELSLENGVLQYMDRCGEYQLWKCTSANTGDSCYFILYEKEIVAYTEMTDGQYDMGIPACLKEGEGTLSVVRMEIASEHELSIKESGTFLFHHAVKSNGSRGHIPPESR